MYVRNEAMVFKLSIFHVIKLKRCQNNNLLQMYLKIIEQEATL